MCKFIVKKLMAIKLRYYHTIKNNISILIINNINIYINMICKGDFRFRLLTSNYIINA